MNPRYIFIILLLLSSAASADKSDIRIGAILPLTGATAIYGLDAQRGLEILEEKLNKQSKKYNYKFVYENGECGKGSASTSAARKLIHVDKVSGLIVGCSGEILQVAPIAEKAKKVAICYACSHPDVKHLGNYIFRTYVDIERGVQDIAQLMNKRHGKHIAILSEENAFNLGIKKILLENLGNDLAFYDDYAEAETDFKALILKAKSRSPEAYYLNPASPLSYQNLIKQLREFGIDEQLYSYYQPGDRDSVANLGQQQNGIVYLDVPDAKSTFPLFKEFYREFLKRHPQGPGIEFLLRTSFDAAYSLFEAIEKVGSHSNLIVKHLDDSKRPGALGTIKFDKNGDVEKLNFVLKQIKKGKPTKFPNT